MSAYQRFLAAALRYGEPRLGARVRDSARRRETPERSLQRLLESPVDLPFAGRRSLRHRRVEQGTRSGEVRVRDLDEGAVVGTLDVATWLALEALLLERFGASSWARLRLEADDAPLEPVDGVRGEWPVGTLVQARPDPTGGRTYALAVSADRWVHTWRGARRDDEDVSVRDLLAELRTSVRCGRFEPRPPDDVVRACAVRVWMPSSIPELMVRVYGLLGVQFPAVAARIGSPDREGPAGFGGRVPPELRALWSHWGASTGPILADEWLLGPRDAAALVASGEVAPGVVPFLRDARSTVGVDVDGLRGRPGCLVGTHGVSDRSLEDWLERFARFLEIGAVVEAGEEIHVSNRGPTPQPFMVTYAAPEPDGPLGTAARRWSAGSWREGDSLVRRVARTLDDPGWQALAAAATRVGRPGREARAVLDDRLRESGYEVPGFLLEPIVRAVVVAAAGA